MTDRPVRVGLVGAGTWASRMHAPTLAAGPETELVAVYARRSNAAADLAERYGARAVSSFAELLDLCEAVAFAVPPDVQAELAPAAAAAGRAMLLEKPLALDLAAAQRVAEAVALAKVPSMMVLTKRFHPRTQSFLAAGAALAAAGPILGIESRYLHGGFLTAEFGHGWRLTGGVLFDLGPHLIDLIEAIAGPIERVRAAGDPAVYLQLELQHRSGTISQMALSGRIGVPAPVTTVNVAGLAGAVSYDTAGMNHDECWPTIRANFARAVRTGTTAFPGAARGLMINAVLDAATISIDTDTWAPVTGIDEL